MKPSDSPIPSQTNNWGGMCQCQGGGEIVSTRAQSKILKIFEPSRCVCPRSLATLLPPALDRQHGHLHGPVASAIHPAVTRSIRRMPGFFVWLALQTAAEAVDGAERPGQCELHGSSAATAAGGRSSAPLIGPSVAECCGNCSADSRCTWFNWHPYSRGRRGPPWCEMLLGPATVAPARASSHHHHLAPSFPTKPPRTLFPHEAPPPLDPVPLET